MLPYIALMAVPVLFQHINIKKRTLDIFTRDKKKTEMAMVIFWIMLFLVLALRHEMIGTDLPNYKNMFEYISRSDWKKALGRSEEIGWSALNKVISILGGSFRTVLIVSAAISTLFTAIAYVKYSKDAVLSIVLYMNLSCFVMVFSGLRQSVAISLGFLAFELVRKKKWFAFLIVVAIAMTFHISAFMILFMYPVYHFRMKRAYLVFIIPLFVLSLLLNRQIFAFLGEILSSFTDYDTTIVETGAYAMLLVFIVLAVISFIITDESEIDDDTIGMRNMLMLAVVLQTFASLHALAMRMNYYYIIFIPLAMSRVVGECSKKWTQGVMLLRYALVIFFAIYFFTTAPEDNALNTFPYKFYWEDDFILK